MDRTSGSSFLVIFMFDYFFFFVPNELNPINSSNSFDDSSAGLDPSLQSHDSIEPTRPASASASAFLSLPALPSPFANARHDALRELSHQTNKQTQAYGPSWRLSAFRSSEKPTFLLLCSRPHIRHASTCPSAAGLDISDHRQSITLSPINMIQPRAIILQTAFTHIAPITTGLALFCRILDNLNIKIAKLCTPSSFQHHCPN